MLFTEGKEKILNIFFKEPLREFYAREISDLSKNPYGRTHQYLNEFHSAGYLKKRVLGRMIFFRLNFEGPTIMKVMELFEVERTKVFLQKNPKFARGLKKYTSNLIDASHYGIQVVALYGSLARGEWSTDSDIDILVVFSLEMNKKDMATCMRKAAASIEGLYKLSPITMNLYEFAEMMDKKNEFFQNFWNDRIILYNEFIFWHFV